jgi:hypothetical protein
LNRRFIVARLLAAPSLRVTGFVSTIPILTAKDSRPYRLRDAPLADPARFLQERAAFYLVPGAIPVRVET